MQTYLDCIPCFYNQALRTARLAGVNIIQQREVLDKVADIMKEISMELSPPFIAKKVYNVIEQITKDGDPFYKVKRDSNKKAMGLYSKVKEEVGNSDDPLLLATKFAIAGNVIDFGTPGKFDIEQEIKNIVHKKLGIFDYDSFKRKLEKAKKILYIGDNAGEIVFDKILIEYMLNVNNKNIVFAVRSKPAINDILMEDARLCGLDKICRIIESGSDVPGTPLEICSSEFLKEFNDADIIISKGQGNIETLIGEKAPIFFMLKVKCFVMADKLDCEVGNIVLKENSY